MLSNLWAATDACWEALTACQQDARTLCHNVHAGMGSLSKVEDPNEPLRGRFLRSNSCKKLQHLGFGDIAPSAVWCGFERARSGGSVDPCEFRQAEPYLHSLGSARLPSHAQTAVIESLNTSEDMCNGVCDIERHLRDIALSTIRRSLKCATLGQQRHVPRERQKHL